MACSPFSGTEIPELPHECVPPETGGTAAERTGGAAHKPQAHAQDSNVTRNESHTNLDLSGLHGNEAVSSSHSSLLGGGSGRDDHGHVGDDFPSKYGGRQRYDDGQHCSKGAQAEPAPDVMDAAAPSHTDCVIQSQAVLGQNVERSGTGNCQDEQETCSTHTWLGRIGGGLAVAGGTAVLLSGVAAGAAVAAGASAATAAAAAASAATAAGSVAATGSAATTAAAGAAVAVAAVAGAASAAGATAPRVQASDTLHGSGAGGTTEGAHAQEEVAEPGMNGALHAGAPGQQVTLADVQPACSTGRRSTGAGRRPSRASSDVHSSEMSSISTAPTSDAGSCERGLSGKQNGVAVDSVRLDHNSSRAAQASDARRNAEGAQAAEGHRGEQRCGGTGHALDCPGREVEASCATDGPAAMGSLEAEGGDVTPDDGARAAYVKENAAGRSVSLTGHERCSDDGAAGDAHAPGPTCLQREHSGEVSAAVGDVDAGLAEDGRERESVDFTLADNPYLEFLRAAVGQETLDEAVAASGDYADEATESMRRRMHEELAAREEAAAAREADAWVRDGLASPAVPLHVRPPLPPGTQPRTVAGAGGGGDRRRTGAHGEGPTPESAALSLDPRRLLDAWDACQSGSSEGALPYLCRKPTAVSLCHVARASVGRMSTATMVSKLV